MQAFYLTFLAIFGLLLGSFLNVCIYRVPRDLSVVFPRSFCPQCGTGIPWYDNVPVVSYFLLRMRCRACGNGISYRYPVVELCTALLLVAVGARYGITLAALKWGVFECFLQILFWTDFEEMILPDELTLGGAVVGSAFAFLVPGNGSIIALLWPGLSESWRSVADSALGASFFVGLFWAVGAVYRRLRRREVLGFGDVKLLLMLGAFLGFENELRALLIGAVSGSVVGGGYILLARKEAGKQELPFGSFLCFGAACIPLFAGR